MPVIARYTEQITVFVTKETKQRIQAVENRLQVSQSQAIRDILDEGLKHLDPEAAG